MDLNSRSVKRQSTTIWVDTSRITMEQGSRFYFDVTNRYRQDAAYIFEVLDFDDQRSTAVLLLEQMTFDLLTPSFRIRYVLDSIGIPGAIADESPPADEADSAAMDEVRDEHIYTHADIPPEFPGGSEALKQWLAKHVRYPAAARKDKIVGLVEVEAVVEKDGRLTGLRIKRDIGGGCGEEALRAIQAMPPWLPGQIKGEEKRVRMVIKVFFPPQ